MNELNETKERKRNTEANDDGQKPLHVVRRKAIAASIWRRQANSGYPYYDYTLSRSWKSASSSKTGYSKNFFDENEQELLQVVQEATAWIKARESEDRAIGAPGAMAA
jgi:hypothetical protein